VNSSEPSAFDSKMLLAIGLTLVTWIGYQSYLQKKYPDAYKASPAKTEGSPTTTATTPSSPPGSVQIPGESPATAVKVLDEKLIEIDGPKWTLVVSNRGLGIRKATLKTYSDRDGRQIVFEPSNEGRLFETKVVGQTKPIVFAVERQGDNQIIGRAEWDGHKIVKSMTIDPDRFLISSSVKVDGKDDSFPGVSTVIEAEVLKKEAGSFFTPSLEHQEFFVNHDGTSDRLSLIQGSEEKKIFQKVSIAALSSQYFTLALVDSSPVIPELQTETRNADVSGKQHTVAEGTLLYLNSGRNREFNVVYKSYLGPKTWKDLGAVHEDLSDVINFGFFKTIANWIFRLLLSIHATVQNWGLAIVLLTVLVRALVLPFNMMSYRSMKAMAKIQPELKTIRERYKDDAQKANQEIMRLMKESKANPLGGCLPIFLQIPVFFALYQVLGQSIELYKAPFMFWIADLSLRDPYFVFPVLMGVTMFVQQKITPSTLEPAQQKILLFMPVFLTFVMAGLPSGLTLYMFVSTLFGVLQQLYFMRDEKRRLVAA
jgi:YidC/Oxa1 family membrane protein insertase